MRCLWMLEEMGEPYRLIEKSTRADDLQSTDYLRLNPNARIPTLVDGDVVLWESMAINLYLAQKYEGPMHCAGPEVLGPAAQWSFWAILEMEALLLELLQHRALLPEFARDASYAERDELLLKKPLGVLNNVLVGRDYLVGNSFTVADLNVASILVWGKMARLDLSSHPQVTRWLDGCLARSAYGRRRNLCAAAKASSDVGCRNPTIGIAACCARAASGHAAAPPTSAMKLRRLMQNLPVEDKAYQRAAYPCRAEHAD
jgi:glutathione S-transferase